MTKSKLVAMCLISVLVLLTLGSLACGGTTNGGMIKVQSEVQVPICQTSGPSAFSIGTGSGDQPITRIDVDNKISFNFTVAGADVFYSVRDPYGNTVLNGNAGPQASSGAGYIVAASSGNYTIHFVSTGTLTSSVITVNYTVCR